jgi:hypothetical protein
VGEEDQTDIVHGGDGLFLKAVEGGWCFLILAGMGGELKLKTRGFRPPTATSSFTGLKEDAEKGLPHFCATFSFINHNSAETSAQLSAPVVNGDLAQWFSCVDVRTGSAVPFLSENPAYEGAGRESAPAFRATK